MITKRIKARPGSDTWMRQLVKEKLENSGELCYPFEQYREDLLRSVNKELKRVPTRKHHHIQSRLLGCRQYLQNKETLAMDLLSEKIVDKLVEIEVLLRSVKWRIYD